MDPYKEFNQINTQWTSVTDLTMHEARARAEARQMRDEYLASAMVKLGKAISGYAQNFLSAPFRTKGA